MSDSFSRISIFEGEIKLFKNYFNSHAVGRAVVRSNGSEGDSVRNPISESAA